MRNLSLTEIQHVTGACNSCTKSGTRSEQYLDNTLQFAGIGIMAGLATSALFTPGSFQPMFTGWAIGTLIGIITAPFYYTPPPVV